ncbi:MAG: hypothetical protein J3R72DRAFT_453392 [Linnemannia gamsii]|nr:MAG: hypothetical protein J3R72DRAFT_453392 [Linnemannia gamsii]
MKIILSLGLAAAVVMVSTSANSLSKRSGPRPSHWSLIDPTYVTCDKELQQSPIDINADTLSRFVSCVTKPLTFDYKPLKDSVAHFNGHTIEFDWTPSATAHNNSITIGKKQHNLTEFHFHTPSEYRIIGRHAVLFQAQAKNVPFKYLTALQKKVHAHPAQHVLHLEGSLNNVIADLIEDDFAASIEDAGFEDGVDGDELVDDGEDAESNELEQDEQGDEFNNAEAEYNTEDETDFASQAFDTELNKDEDQVDINTSIVKAINRKAQQDPFIVNNESNNNNGDNNQDSQDTNYASASSSSPEDILSSEAA